MKPLGQITFTASDTDQYLGPITLGEGDDTIWLDVTQVSPTENWRYAFCLVSFVTDEGAELGTTRVYGNQSGEVFRLGVRRPPLLRTGRIRVFARHYNLAWLNAKNAPDWVLSFQWEAGKTSSTPADPGLTATLGVLADLVGAGVSYAINPAGFATIKLLPKP